MKSQSLIILTLFSFSCMTKKVNHKGRTQMSSEITNNALSLSDATKISDNFLPPQVKKESFSLGGKDVLMLSAKENKESPSYYSNYELCAKKCTKDTLFWDTPQIYPHLSAGVYKVKDLTSCNKFKGSEICGKRESEFQFKVTRKNEFPIDVRQKIKDLKEVKESIRTTGEELWKSIDEYKKNDSYEKNKELENMHALGAKTLGQMISSEGYIELFKNRYKSSILGGSSDSESKDDFEKRLLKKMDERISSNNTDQLLLGFGIASVLVGSVMVGTSWYLKNSPESIRFGSKDIIKKSNINYKKLVEGSVDTVRKILYSALGGQVSMTKDLLKMKNPGLEALQTDGANSVFRTTSGDLWIKDAKDLLYKVNSGAYEIEDLKIKKGLQISESQYEKLAASGSQAQIDFQKAKTGDNYILKSGRENNYVTISGKTYRKTWPETGNVFPRLSQNTMDTIYNNWTKMKQEGHSKADSEYGKGIPLFDTHGRLVEPPETWRVVGENWYVDTRGYQTSTTDKFTLETAYKNFKDIGLELPQGVTKKTIYDRTKRGWLKGKSGEWLPVGARGGNGVYIYSDKYEPAAKGWLNTMTGSDPVTTQIEPALRYQEQELTKVFKNSTESANTKILEFSENTARKIESTRTSLNIGGPLLIAAGAAAIGAWAASNLAESENKLNFLNAYEKKITLLHRNLLKGALKVNKLIKPSPSSTSWVYYL